MPPPLAGVMLWPLLSAVVPPACMPQSPTAPRRCSDCGGSAPCRWKPAHGAQIHHIHHHLGVALGLHVAAIRVSAIICPSVRPFCIAKPAPGCCRDALFPLITLGLFGIQREQVAAIVQHEAVAGNGHAPSRSWQNWNSPRKPCCPSDRPPSSRWYRRRLRPPWSAPLPCRG